MKKEMKINLDGFVDGVDVEEIMDFFKTDDFDVELVTDKDDSMSGHVVTVKCIKIARKG